MLFLDVELLWRALWKTWDFDVDKDDSDEDRLHDTYRQ